MLELVLIQFGLRSDDKPHAQCSLEPFSILVYSHVGHSIIHLIVDQYLKKQHKLNRLNGYLEFYLGTVVINRCAGNLEKNIKFSLLLEKHSSNSFLLGIGW